MGTVKIFVEEKGKKKKKKGLRGPDRVTRHRTNRSKRNEEFHTTVFLIRAIVETKDKFRFEKGRKEGRREEGKKEKRPQS